jgi:integrase
MASVLPRTNRDGSVSWRVQFRIDGQMRQETFHGVDAFDSATQFGKLVDKVGGVTARKVLEARHTSPVDMPTLREFTRTYLNLDSGLLTGIEPGTRAGYENAADRSFLQVLGDFPVNAIRKSDVGRWVAWQEQQPSARYAGRTVAAKTVRNYHAILSAVLACAVEEKLRDDNPAYRTRLSEGSRREPVFLSPAEFATVLFFTPERYRRFVYFLGSTGCRWGEATAVTWADLNDADPATLRIDKAWKKSAGGAPVLKHPKSKMARRTIGVHRPLVLALGDPRDAPALIFPGPQSGGHLWYGRFRSTTWDPTIARAMDREQCVEHGLTPLSRRPTIHDLRHSHASWLIAGGVPLPYIQARLGHESITTTVGVYGHLVPDAHRQMADVVAASIGPDALAPGILHTRAAIDAASS